MGKFTKQREAWPISPCRRKSARSCSILLPAPARTTSSRAIMCPLMRPRQSSPRVHLLAFLTAALSLLHGISVILLRLLLHTGRTERCSLVAGTRRCDHITPVFRTLVTSTTARMECKPGLQGAQQPDTTVSVRRLPACWHYTGRRQLRSSSALLLVHVLELEHSSIHCYPSRLVR